MQERAPPTDPVLVQAHERLLRDESLQFDRVGFTPPSPPGWLAWIGDLLQALAPALTWVFWIGLALLAGLILYAIGREILRLRAPHARPQISQGAGESEWRPAVETARNLLAEADALAGQGRHEEAVHLLLLRSVADIAQRQPGALRVSLTSREIATLRALPDTARPAFALIAATVERSLFGGSPLGQADFSACRQAYEAFALPQGWDA